MLKCWIMWGSWLIRAWRELSYFLIKLYYFVNAEDLEEKRLLLWLRRHVLLLGLQICLMTWQMLAHQNIWIYHHWHRTKVHLDFLSIPVLVIPTPRQPVFGIRWYGFLSSRTCCSTKCAASVNAEVEHTPCAVHLMFALFSCPWNECILWTLNNVPLHSFIQ